MTPRLDRSAVDTVLSAFDRPIERLDVGSAVPDWPFLGQVQDGLEPLGWHIASLPAMASPWIHVDHVGGSGAAPAQGWKLHVTASPWNAGAVLDSVISVVKDDPVAWKVLPSPLLVRSVNAGEAGVTQLGKFITLYPTTDEQAARLARVLDEAIDGPPRPVGPLPPSDRAVRPGSPVSYRYGIFDAVQSDLIGPEGEALPDRRVGFHPPPWSVDPIAAPPGLDGVDIDTGTAVVVKVSGAGRAQAEDGRDGRDLGRHEASMLERLDDVPGVPALREVIDEGDVVAIVMEHVDGRSLDRVVARRAAEDGLPGPEELVALARALGRAVAGIHDRGIVIRDLAPSNVLVRDRSNVSIIDLELALALDDPDPFPSIGTRGFAAPQQVLGWGPAIADDLWSFGALVRMLATGSNPSMAADPYEWWRVPLPSVRPDLAQLAPVLDRCQALDREDRPASVHEVLDALDRLDSTSSGQPSRARSAGLPPRPAMRLDALAATLHDTVASSRGSESHLDPSLYTGLAGGLLVLLADAGDDPGGGARQLAAEMLPAVAAASRSFEAPGAGLLSGPTSVALVCAVAGARLDDPHLRELGVHLREGAATWGSERSDDVVSGTAGRLLADLWMDDLLGTDLADPAVVHDLLDRRHEHTWWDRQGPAPHLGYGHGVAGIADVLLRAHERWDVPEALAAALDARELLARTAVPCLDGRGATWPSTPDGRRGLCGWCHGSVGVADFLLHVADHDREGDAGLTEAALTAAAGHHLGNRTSSLCCGLSGACETLLDGVAAGVVGPERLEVPTVLLESFVVEREGRVVAIDELPSSFVPSLYRGYAGVLVTLRRLRAGGGVPRLMSLDGLRAVAAGRWRSDADADLG